MATYRYLFGDLLSNTILQEIPLQGVTFGRRISKPGNFQGTLSLGNAAASDIENPPSDNDLLDATESGKSCLYIERTGDEPGAQPQLVWGGIIWSRVWQEQSKTLQLTGQTFESFPYVCDLRTTLSFLAGGSGDDQREIVRQLFITMQAMTNRNIGIQVPGTAFTGGIPHYEIFYPYGAWTFGKILDHFLEYEDTFDYYIDVYYDSNGLPAKALRVDNTLGAPVSSTNYAFDYPGNIKNFWWPENAKDGAVSVYAVGNGQDAAMVRALVTDTSYFAKGYPDIVQFFTDKDQSNSTVLAGEAAQYLQSNPVPVSVPTFETNPEIVPRFGDYSLGDYANIKLVSDFFSRLPDSTKETTIRIIGWDVTPPQSDNTEQVKLVITGQD